MHSLLGSKRSPCVMTLLMYHLDKVQESGIYASAVLHSMILCLAPEASGRAAEDKRVIHDRRVGREPR
jgi:hypothetical protein